MRKLAAMLLLGLAVLPLAACSQKAEQAKSSADTDAPYLDGNSGPMQTFGFMMGQMDVVS